MADAKVMFASDSLKFLLKNFITLKWLIIPSVKSSFLY
jgi:hypothetical protein